MTGIRKLVNMCSSCRLAAQHLSPPHSWDPTIRFLTCFSSCSYKLVIAAKCSSLSARSAVFFWMRLLFFCLQSETAPSRAQMRSWPQGEQEIRRKNTLLFLSDHTTNARNKKKFPLLDNDLIWLMGSCLCVL